MNDEPAFTIKPKVWLALIASGLASWAVIIYVVCLIF